MKEKILKLIQDSEHINVHKNIMKGVIHRYYEYKEEQDDINNLVRDVSKTSNSFEVVLSCKDLIIYKEAGSDMRFIFKNGEKWKRSHWVVESLDQVLLYYLAEKYDDINSRFPMYAYRMLDMDNKY